jgi:hypothetical protein
MNIDAITSSPVGTRLLDDLVTDELGTARALSELSESELYEYVTGAAVEVSSEKWSPTPGRSWPWEARVSPAVAERLARGIVTSTAAKWWSVGCGARPQVWIGREFSAPAAGIASPGLAGKPTTAIWTSSAVAGLPSAWWSVLKDGADSAPPEGPQAIWRLTPHPDARVFEIRTPADWGWLCEAFPGPAVDGWVTPGWETAKEVFDGIHLTVEGLIRCQGAAVETAHGIAKLDHWDAESTAWLRWSVASLERLGSVSSARSRTPQARRGGFVGVRRGRASPRALRRS